MRCWRITTSQNVSNYRKGEYSVFYYVYLLFLVFQGPERCEESDDFSLELSFEYLVAKNQLQWITITSEQAILMSVCLQAMIDELLLKNAGGSKPQVNG